MIDPNSRLPCDVRIPPNTLIRKGCRLSTLLEAIAHREEQRSSLTEFPGSEAFQEEVISLLLPYRTRNHLTDLSGERIAAFLQRYAPATGTASAGADVKDDEVRRDD